MASEVLNFFILWGDGRPYWLALLIGSGDGQRYAGSSTRSPWEAMAWALDERAHRRHGIVRLTELPGATPTLEPDPRLIEEAKARNIRREQERVRLPLVEAPCTKSKSAAARRARSKKSGAKPGASH